MSRLSRVRRSMSTARSLNFEFVVLIVIQNQCWGGGGGGGGELMIDSSSYVALDLRPREVQLASCRHLAVYHFHNKDNF